MSKPINCDNFMSNRPSTRVHAPAGGRSSLDLFGGFAEAEARREAMPARGRRAGYTPPVGRAEPAPVATRAAPVAARADPYASRAAPRAAPRAAAEPAAVSAHSAAPRTAAPAARGGPAPSRAEPATRAAAPLRGSGTSANVFASGANQNCGNFITDRPTSRVLSAPGGRSSIVLG